MSTNFEREKGFIQFQIGVVQEYSISLLVAQIYI